MLKIEYYHNILSRLLSRRVNGNKQNSMESIGIAVAPVLDAVRNFALEKTKLSAINPTIWRILVFILTDKKSVQMSSLMYVDFAQAIENLSNANSLLEDEKSEELENELLFKGSNSFDNSSITMLKISIGKTKMLLNIAISRDLSAFNRIGCVCIWFP
jgi:hypothetical protein